MAITNIFETLLGRDDLTWHALWRFLAWLCEPAEGHGLHESFNASLMTFTFGQPLSPARLKREFRLEDPTTPGGKWPDLAIGIPDLAAPSHLVLMDDVDRRRVGEARKLNNLKTYCGHAQTLFPEAWIRLLVLTNASSDTDVARLREALGAEVVDDRSRSGWKILPLRTTGEWVSGHLSKLDNRMQILLSDYVAWTRSVDQRPEGSV